MGQYCFARCRLSSSVTLPAGGPAAGRVGGRAARQYGYVPLGRHFVLCTLAARRTTLTMQTTTSRSSAAPNGDQTLDAPIVTTTGERRASLDLATSKPAAAAAAGLAAVTESTRGLPT